MHVKNGDYVTGNKTKHNIEVKGGAGIVGTVGNIEVKDRATVAGRVEYYDSQKLDNLAQEITKLLDYIEKNPPLNEAITIVNTKSGFQSSLIIREKTRGEKNAEKSVFS